MATSSLALSARNPKRPRSDGSGSIQPPGTPAQGGFVPFDVNNDPVPMILGGPDQQDQLVSREFTRLSFTANPDFATKLRNTHSLGFNRPVGARAPTMRYYTLNVRNLFNAFNALTTSYLKFKLYEAQVMSYAEADAEVAVMAPIIANACMAALYARLRNIHQQFQEYATRYTARPSYNKAIELPLPFADAVQNIGVFSPVGTLTNIVVVPNYPEGTQNEGRSTQNWSSYQYEAYIPQLKSLGIPLKSVDTHLKTGSLWWTYSVSYVNDTFDLRCIYPPINYTDHSVMLAGLFLVTNAADHTVLSIVQRHADEILYAYRARELPDDYNMKAFSALIHSPPHEWSQYLITN